MTSNNETVHVSFGNTANHITSHLLNLQGLAATSGAGGDDSFKESLCDPSVTHDITSAESDYYATTASSSSARKNGRYMYVPRALIIDGRDSFGVGWGSSNKNNPSSGGGTSAESCAAWNGKVSLFDASNHDAMFAGNQSTQQQMEQSNIITANTVVDPLDNFRTSASVVGLSHQFTRFNAEPPSSYNSGLYSSNNNGNRHVQWDDFEEGEEDDDDDEYCYGQDRERMQELRRRQLESKNEDMKSGFNDTMATAWEEAFYGQQQSNQSRDDESGGEAKTTAPATTSDSSSPNTNNNNTAPERNIYWHDYFMPPRPQPSKYQVPLPFDTGTNILSSSSSSSSNNNNNNNNDMTWSSSFAGGYQQGGGYIFQSWRENVLSEALRKVLEGCDIVKGFNLTVDGGTYGSDCGGGEEDASSGGGSGGNKHAKQLTQIIAGGGFHGGLATSFLEELQEECRSAGRLAILVDPIVAAATNNNNNNEANPVEIFRRSLNTGLALHGLSTNSDAFLPVSIDGAHRALYGDNRATSSSQNRKLFEGSAAIALALESSTLFYRLRRDKPSNQSNNQQYSRRSRLGVQSGFYQGYSGNNGYDDDANDPFATASSLTYHEFLACARPSSDRRRSILEIDALVRPLSRPSAGGARAGGVDIASLLARNGTTMSQELLQLSLAGIIGGNSSQDHFGELHERMMRGTRIEEMRLEQDRNRSRGRSSSSRNKGPGEWMEDSVGGGVLSSLSGNEIAFGRRADHHHFALLSSLRPSAAESRRCNLAESGGCTGVASAYLRPIMESMGMKYRPEVSSGLVVRDTVAQLTGVSSYWGSVFAERLPSSATAATGTAVAGEKLATTTTQQQQSETAALSPTDIANNTPVLSILGNSTRSYPRLNSISTGFVDALHSRSNKGYFSRDVMSGLIPEQDDCEDALEYCRELVDVYEPPMGSGLVVGEEIDAYFDEDA